MMSGRADDGMPSTDLYNEYDMKFTADISRRMQMPERLAAVDGMRQLDGFTLNQPSVYMTNSPAFGMTMPDRLVLGETEYKPDSHLPVSNGFSDDDYIEFSIESQEPQSYVNVTPVKKKENTELFSASELVVPPTPSSMLRDARNGGGDITNDWVKIQRHVAKLTCRVERLEEENSRRRQREWILYPLVIGYCVIQVARMLFGRSK